MALAMATFGAKGNTALQMRNALYMAENESWMLNCFQNFINELNVCYILCFVSKYACMF